MKSVKKILLKISGEVLLPPQSQYGLHFESARRLADLLSNFYHTGYVTGVVIGGGNILRGRDFKETPLQRTVVDQMGMLGTVLNAMLMREELERRGIPAAVLSAINVPGLVEIFSWEGLQRALQDKKIILFCGGTGQPYFSTDSAAAIRAAQMEADLLIKATKVKGVFSEDPQKNESSIWYPQISYERFLAEKLRVIDATAVAICESQQIPLFVCSMDRLFSDPLETILSDRHGGSWIKRESQ